MARLDQEGVEWVRRCCASAPGGGLSAEAAEELARRLAGRAALLRLYAAWRRACGRQHSLTLVLTHSVRQCMTLYDSV